MKIFKVLEQFATAAAFAEAGQVETALSVMNESTYEKNIIIAFENNMLSDKLIQHSLAVSKRIQCNTIFTNVVTGAPEQKLPVIDAEKVIQRVKSLDIYNVEKSAREDLYRYMTIYGDFANSVSMICKKIKHVEFAILQSTTCPSVSLKMNIPYFIFD